MRILWVKSDFLHPTTRGGRIRTLEMLRRLHANHEIHYIAYEDRRCPEGVQRACEYASAVYPVPTRVKPWHDPRIVLDLAKGFLSPLPVGLARYCSAAMRSRIAETLARHRFDSVVCDFLIPAPNFPTLEGCVLFQHNVETMIWARHAENAPDPLRRAFFGREAKRMRHWEAHYCRQAGHVVAVSESDASLMREQFGVTRVTAVPTGVDLEYFARPATVPRIADLVFVGSMAWLPNIDGVRWFVREVLPLIRRSRPDCTLAIVGSSPVAAVRALASRDRRITVTGTVPDVRPYLWGAAVSIVPLRIGGGTRLKIYEAMAARVPVVSTTVGAEGLKVSAPGQIRLADTPEDFASQCLQLLDSRAGEMVAAEAFRAVSAQCSWDRISSRFEEILRICRFGIH